MRLAAIALLLLSPVVDAQEARPPLTLVVETLPKVPRPGDRVSWIARLTNTSGRDLEVPAQLREWLHVVGHFRRPDDGSGYGIGGMGLRRDPPPIVWIPFPRGATIERFGDAGELVEECRRGCPVGTLSVNALVNPDRPAQSEGAQVVPAALRVAANVEVARPSADALQLFDESAVAVSIRSAKAARDGSIVRIRLENKGASALWVPRANRLTVTCHVVDESPETGSIGMAGNSGLIGPTWGPREGVRIAARSFVDVNVTCPPLPRHGTIAVTIAPDGLFESATPITPPFVWAGRTTSEAWRIDRR